MVEQPDGTLVLKAMTRRASAAKGEAIRYSEGRIIGPLSARARALAQRSRIEVELLPQRFVFRPLELPQKASEFLGGIIRAQIDRLAPWPATQAAFGWSAPAEIGGARVRVTVAITAREAIASLAQAVAELKPDSIVCATVSEASDGAPAARIEVFEQRLESQRRALRLRRLLIATLALVGFAAMATAVAWIFVGNNLDAQRLKVARQIAARRVALMSGRGTAAEEAFAALGKKKHETPSSVIILDQLSQALPDDTYLIELRLEEGNKLQIAGITRDAPALIRTIEQSAQFTRATFFAPTTKSPNESGERFHIQAHVEPYFPVGP